MGATTTTVSTATTRTQGTSLRPRLGAQAEVARFSLPLRKTRRRAPRREPLPVGFESLDLNDGAGWPEMASYAGMLRTDNDDIQLPPPAVRDPARRTLGIRPTRSAGGGGVGAVAGRGGRVPQPPLGGGGFGGDAFGGGSMSASAGRGGRRSYSAIGGGGSTAAAGGVGGVLGGAFRRGGASMIARSASRASGRRPVVELRAESSDANDGIPVRTIIANPIVLLLHSMLIFSVNA